MAGQIRAMRSIKIVTKNTTYPNSKMALTQEMGSLRSSETAMTIGVLWLASVAAPPARQD